MLGRQASSAFSSSTITVPSGKTASDLTNYPVYLRLSDMPSGFWSAVASDGGNIRIKQSGSVIPFEVVTIDTTGHTGTIFFKASTLATAADNVFTLDLTGGALLAVNDANGRNNVWSAFDWVWMANGTGDLTDRTGGADGSRTNTFSAATSMGLNPQGTGVQCSGSTTRLDFGSRTSRTVFTLGGSVRLDVSSVSTSRTWLMYCTSTSVRVGMSARDTTTDNWSAWDNSNSWLGTTGPSLSSTVSTASRFHLVYNGSTNRKYYSNGAIHQTSGAITARPNTDVTYVVGAANTSSAEGYLNGYLSYLYSRPEALSADYIAAEYSNINAPASFYTIT
jgi:hypothetical protein